MEKQLVATAETQPRTGPDCCPSEQFGSFGSHITDGDGSRGNGGFRALTWSVTFVVEVID